MNIETKLDSRLWQSIRGAYESRNYTGAILDAVYFLSDLIREKSGLDSDGVPLVGKAFGGKSPILKVNKLQSESERNVQRGVEQLLRGLYQAVRNPRSHEKHTDKLEDAAAIILFINYLIGIIDKSKTPFSKSGFLKRVFDPSFVQNDRYAELLVKEIPPKQRFDVFLDVYRNKETGEGKKLKYFVSALLKRLTKEEKKEVCRIVSDELNRTNEHDTITRIVTIFPDSYWEQYEEVARLRMENKFIDSIRAGRYSRDTKKCLDGALGTWADSVFRHFLLKKELVNAFIAKLHRPDRFEQDYVFQFFFDKLIELDDPPGYWTISVIEKGLKNGIKRFHDALAPVMVWGTGPKSWEKAFKESYEAFEESEEISEPTEDDIPF